MLVDSHCHLDRLNLASYAGDLSLAMAAAKNCGVGKFLCIGIGHRNFQQVIEISRKYPEVFATAGLHPLEFGETDPLEANKIHDWLMNAAQDSRVIGIGETGLDYYYTKDHVYSQKESFVIHLQVAKKLSKPVVVHTRNAREDTLALIQQHGCRDTAGVLHCFTENWEMAKQALDLNYFISFSGIITFKNAFELREVVKKVPLDRLLVETDSPYLAPMPYRGKPNEPKNVVEVAHCVADIKGIDFEKLCQQTSQNFSALFGV